MTLGAEQRVCSETVVIETLTGHGAFERFKKWVVGLSVHPRPSAGFGGPIETPFANTIPTPEKEAFGGYPSANDYDEHLTSAEVANAIRSSYDGTVTSGSVSGYLREVA